MEGEDLQTSFSKPFLYVNYQLTLPLYSTLRASEQGLNNFFPLFELMIQVKTPPQIETRRGQRPRP